MVIPFPDYKVSGMKVRNSYFIQCWILFLKGGTESRYLSSGGVGISRSVKWYVFFLYNKTSDV